MADRKLYPQTLSATALKAAHRKADAYIKKLRADAASPKLADESFAKKFARKRLQEIPEIRQGFESDQLQKQQGNHVHGIAKRLKTINDKRLAATLGLTLPSALGNWQHASKGYALGDLPKKGWSLLRLPALMPAEMSALRQDLIKALPAATPAEFCIDVRDKIGPHYKVDKIMIARALQKRMQRQKQAVDLQPVLTPYLTIAEQRMKTMNGLAARLNELSGNPAWSADFEPTQSSEKGSVSLKFNLGLSPNYCEAWEGGHGQGALGETIHKHGLRMWVHT